MSWFEVFIPAKDENSMNMTLTVEAPNWIGALRTGLGQIGEGQEAISNVMCDIKEDNSIHVTNPNTGRVFKLHEMAGPPDVAAPPPSKDAPAPEPVVEADDAVEEVVATPPEPEPMPEPEPEPEPAPVVAKKEKKKRSKEKAPPPKRETGQFEAAPAPAQTVASAPAATDIDIGRKEPVAETINVNDVIADIFDATQDLQFDGSPDPSQVAETLLDIALEKIPADAGTFYLADINGSELVFEAVRGPKAADIKKRKLTVPVGQGIVGFCAQEGICLVIEDMKHDQRYFSAIADAVGYTPQNTLCASAEKEGRLFGAIQLINAKRGAFTAGEMEVVRYIGLTAAEMLDRAD
jgi:putative methionine-R-sulfoxide reductase with GAF domain